MQYYPPQQNPWSGGQLPPQVSRYAPFQPQSFPARPNQANIEVFQVTNVEEAKAQLVNPAAPTMFCNFGQNEIYVKYLDNNGQGQFCVFKLVMEQDKGQVDPLVVIPPQD